MTKAEELIVEFHELSMNINKTIGQWYGDCELFKDSVMKINCIEHVYSEAKSDNYEYGIDLDDVCEVCRNVLDNAKDRSNLKIQRGYVKNKMHNLAKKLIKESKNDKRT